MVTDLILQNILIAGEFYCGRGIKTCKIKVKTGRISYCTKIYKTTPAFS